MSTTTGVFVGRFQAPEVLHDGHKACIDKILEEKDRVLILVRDTETSEKNPHSAAFRVAKIMEAYKANDKVYVSTVPDPGADLTFFIGRDVGYGLVELDPETEAISATDLRKEMYEMRQRRETGST